MVRIVVKLATKSPSGYVVLGMSAEVFGHSQKDSALLLSIGSPA